MIQFDKYFSNGLKPPTSSGFKGFLFSALYPWGREPPILTDAQMSHNGLVETNHQLENRCFNSNVGIFEALEGNQLTAFLAMQCHLRTEPMSPIKSTHPEACYWGIKLWEVQIDLQDFFGCCWSDSWGDRSDYLLMDKTTKHKRRQLECLRSLSY